MKIEYLGVSSFLLKGKNTNVITDPFDKDQAGIKFPKNDAAIVTVSTNNPLYNATYQVGGEKVVFDFPGEYERQGVRIYSYQDKIDSNNLIFKIIIDGIIVLHCGALSQIPENGLIEDLKDADVLLVPVGGESVLSAKDAKKMVELVKPEIIIPMHYKNEKYKNDYWLKYSRVEDFLKVMDQEKLVAVEKLNVQEGQLPERELVWLTF